MSDEQRMKRMDAGRWRRVAGVVEVALELDRATRAAYLESLARHDPDFQGQVRGVLRHLGEIDSADETTIDGLPGAPDPADRLGPYRPVRLLGRGGMGSVFLGERIDRAYERHVAIKVIDAGLDVPTVHQRFLSERQILASFDHPNIARLYDGGTARDGRPFLVMEYVDGLPIDRFCFDQGLDLEKRLLIFGKVCSALAYAHRHQVVHRDLKPSNILVTAAGEPKLLDFGIAKLLDPQSFPVEVAATYTSARPMTPNWATPEQLNGEPITAATDVYALGLLLYKLLTGRLPFGTRRTIAEALEALDAITTTPPKPSQALQTKAENDQEAWKGADLEALRREIRGDLDAIVLKTLRFDPEERYPSAEALEQDLHRLVTGEPVSAKEKLPGGWWRRLVKSWAWQPP